jgi:Uma2 family endonuclease
MSVVSYVEAWPARGQPFTVDDLDRLPDDGRRYELFDGVLVVSPRPTTVHQLAAARLVMLLGAACPEHLCVVPEPAVMLSASTEFDPDVVVVPLDEMGGAKLTAPPLLVIEIRSPSTALIDLNRKKTAYQEFGVASYWMVDPDPRKPSLTAFQLRDGRYGPPVTVTGNEALETARPFAVKVVPARLLAGLPGQGRDGA